MARLPDPRLRTALTVEPADAGGLAYLHLAQGDRRELTFDAGQAVAAVAAELQAVASRATVDGPVAAGGGAGALAAVALASPVATVTLDGATLAIGAVYELLVTFTAAGGERWTRTLPVECVG